MRIFFQAMFDGDKLDFFGGRLLLGWETLAPEYLENNDCFGEISVLLVFGESGIFYVNFTTTQWGTGAILSVG